MPFQNALPQEACVQYVELSNFPLSVCFEKGSIQEAVECSYVINAPN
jgi:hypothetical protein